MSVEEYKSKSVRELRGMRAVEYERGGSGRVWAKREWESMSVEGVGEYERGGNGSVWAHRSLRVDKYEIGGEWEWGSMRVEYGCVGVWEWESMRVRSMCMCERVLISPGQMPLIHHTLNTDSKQIKLLLKGEYKSQWRDPDAVLSAYIHTVYICICTSYVADTEQYFHTVP